MPCGRGQSKEFCTFVFCRDLKVLFELEKQSCETFFTFRRNLEDKRNQLRKKQIIEERWILQYVFFIIFFQRTNHLLKVFLKSLINIIERREQQRSNRARRAKDNSRGEENKLQTNLRPREENKLQSQESTNQATSVLSSAQIDPRKENEEKRPRVDFSNILNSTAIEGGNSLEQFHQMQLPPMTSAASESPSPIREKVKVAQSPEIEFLEAREVECPDCDKKFAARAKLLAHLVSAHYSEKIFKIHPFQKNAPCPLCINSGNRRTTEYDSPCFIFNSFSQNCVRAT